jgi:hypothetical protein
VTGRRYNASPEDVLGAVDHVIAAHPDPANARRHEQQCRDSESRDQKQCPQEVECVDESPAMAEGGNDKKNQRKQCDPARP